MINWTSSKLRFFSKKDHFKRMKGRTAKWEKTFADYISDQGLVEYKKRLEHIRILKIQK